MLEKAQNIKAREREILPCLSSYRIWIKWPYQFINQPWIIPICGTFICVTERGASGLGEMAQWVKALGSRSNQLSLTPRTHAEEGARLQINNKLTHHSYIVSGIIYYQEMIWGVWEGECRLQANTKLYRRDMSILGLWYLFGMWIPSLVGTGERLHSS